MLDLSSRQCQAGQMREASWRDRLAKWPESLKLSDEEAKKPRREV